MALPQFFRIIVPNNSGQTVTYDSGGRYNLKLTGWIDDPATGKKTYTPLSNDDLSFGTGNSTVDGAEEKSDEVDNTTTRFQGVQVQLEVTHDEGTAATGTFDLYLDGGDATGELMSDATGYNNAAANGLTRIGSLTWEANGQDDEVMRSEVFSIGG